MIVTAVERQRRQRRVNVFVDGRFALVLGAQLAAERDVRPGRSLTSDELSALAEAEARRSALESALRLLAYRPRSERELRDRLARKGYRRAVIDQTLSRLQELGYLDDAAFARFWAETRQSLRPRSGRLLAVELRRLGVTKETAEEATADISEEDAAYQAAGARLRVLRGLEYPRFRERLGRFLTRRGFTYDVARRTIERCWEESGEGPTESETS
jgi:regulatory protein